MPYRKRSYSVRRRTSRRRSMSNTPWYDRKYSTSQLARKAWQATKYLKGLVNSERMYYDTSLNYNVTNTGLSLPLTAISQGDGPNQRTGNSILVRSLTYRYSLEINPNVTSNTRATFLIVQDTQQIADATPQVTNLLSTLSPESLLNTGTAGRFKLLERKTIVLTPASAGTPCKQVSGYLNLQTHVRYNGPGDGDIQKGGLYFMWVSSEATNYPLLKGSLRIGYHDN